MQWLYKAEKRQLGLVYSETCIFVHIFPALFLGPSRLERTGLFLKKHQIGTLALFVWINIFTRWNETPE